ncbi:hypothetical protein LXL04_034839 [Taraxacum kok-saghyz]
MSGPLNAAKAAGIKTSQGQNKNLPHSKSLGLYTSGRENVGNNREWNSSNACPYSRGQGSRMNMASIKCFFSTSTDSTSDGTSYEIYLNGFLLSTSDFNLLRRKGYMFVPLLQSLQGYFWEMLPESRLMIAQHSVDGDSVSKNYAYGKTVRDGNDELNNTLCRVPVPSLTLEEGEMQAPLRCTKTNLISSFRQRLIEFSYNNSYHSTIKAEPFEVL